MPQSADVPEITPTELKARLDNGDVPALVDVREAFERRIADLPENGQARIPTGEFLHRLGEDAARTFRRLLEALPGLRILDSDDGHRAAVWSKLDALRGVKLTYVDASSLVWIERRKIATVWATDHHLAVGGAEVVPGPPPT